MSILEAISEFRAGLLALEGLTRLVISMLYHPWLLAPFVAVIFWAIIGFRLAYPVNPHSHQI
jgi:hypothetical protein